MRARPDGEPRVPFPLSDVSNGEWCPATAVREAAARRPADRRGVRPPRAPPRHDAGAVPPHGGGDRDRLLGPLEAPESTRGAEDDMPIRGSYLCGEVASEMSAPLYPPPRPRREA